MITLKNFTIETLTNKLSLLLKDKLNKIELKEFSNAQIFVVIYTNAKINFSEAGYIAEMVDNFNNENKVHYLFTLRGIK